MALKPIQFKHGNKANLPTEAPVGSLLVTIDTKELFVGMGAGELPFSVAPKVKASTKVDLSGPTILSITDGDYQPFLATGDFNISITDWPVAGQFGEFMIEIENGGAFTSSFNSIIWIKQDGTQASTFADSGIILQSVGVNFFLFWTTDGGITVWGRVL